MKLSKILICSVLGLTLLAITAVPVLALDLYGQDDSGGSNLETVATGAEYSETNLVETIGRIIKLALGFLGLVTLILIIVGGFQWMTSGGDDEKIAGAKKLISAAVVGLFIIILAYALTTFVINRLTEVSGQACEPNQLKCVTVGTAATPGTYSTCTAEKTWGDPTPCTSPNTYCAIQGVQPVGTPMCSATAPSGQ